MTFLPNNWVVRFCTAFVCCFAIAFTSRAALVNPDFQIGPNVQLDSLTVASSGLNYLVSWRDLSGGPNASQIFGSLVSQTGVAGAAFPISDAGGIPQSAPVQRIRAAFDGTNYLVVWHDLRAGGTGVRGVRVSPQGAIVGGSDFLIANAVNSTNVNPQVSYSGGGSFFVAWQDSPLSGTGTEIFYTKVASDSSVTVVQSIPALNLNTVAQKFEFIVPGQSGENLIVYQDVGSTPNATYAVRINFDNSISGPASGSKMFTNDFSSGGAGAPIGGGYDIISQQYILLATLGTQLTCSVSTARLTSDGRVALSTAPFALVGQGLSTLDENKYPLAVFNGSDEFLFLRNSVASDVAYHIFMKRVNIDGTDEDINMTVVDEASSGILNGAVAAAAGSQYLTVWMDGRRRVTDPPMQTNVFGALIDGTQLGNTLRPYIRPGGGITPIFGIAPLTLTTGPGNSTGIVDGGQWDFGDGSAPTDIITTTHKYVNAGSYIAVFSLFKAGLAYNQFFQIDVESTEIGGGGGPPQTIGGVLQPNSAGINTDVIITNFVATLNFAKTNADSFRLNGKFDVTRLPLYLTGQTCTFKIGTNSYTFDLLAGGTFVSAAGTTPVITFQVEPFSGLFLLTSTSDNLQTALNGTGVANVSASKLPVNIPVSASFAGMSDNELISAQYTATVGIKGTVTYTLGTTGAPSDGYFGTSFGYATERLMPVKTGEFVHDFGIGGNLTLPNATTLVKAPAGTWRFTVGNYSEDVPTSLVTLSGSTYKYTPKRVSKGITLFAYNSKSGAYSLILKGIPATGVNASGMAISTNLVTRADMVVSFDLDLDGGSKIQASNFIRYVRKDVTKKKWGIR